MPLTRAPDRVVIADGAPRILHELLVAERHALGRRVVLEHDHVHFVVDLEDLGRVADAAPGHVGDVEQAVDAAEVDEGAVVGDVLHDAAQHLALGEGLERLLLLLGVLLLEQDLAREDDVAALLVDLDDAHAQLLAAQGVQVAHGPHVDLAAGQEGAHADVHGEAALDALDDAADDDLALRVRALDLVPDLHLLGFFAREDDVPVAVFGLLEEHVHDVTGLHGDLAVLVEELVDADDAFRLEADVDDDLGLGDLEHGALDHLAFRDVSEAVIVDVQQAGVFRRVHRVFFVRGSRPRCARRVTSLDSGRGLSRHQVRRLLVFDVRHCVARPPFLQGCRGLG